MTPHEIHEKKNRENRSRVRRTLKSTAPKVVDGLVGATALIVLWLWFFGPFVARRLADYLATATPAQLEHAGVVAGAVWIAWRMVLHLVDGLTVHEDDHDHHLVRRSAYWPCETVRAIAVDPAVGALVCAADRAAAVEAAAHRELILDQLREHPRTARQLQADTRLPTRVVAQHLQELHAADRVWPGQGVWNLTAELPGALPSVRSEVA